MKGRKELFVFFCVHYYLRVFFTEFIGTTETFHEIAIAPKSREYILSVMDQEGNELRQKVVVK